MAHALLIESIVNSDANDTREKRDHAIDELERELLLPIGSIIGEAMQGAIRLEHNEAPHRAPITAESPALPEASAPATGLLEPVSMDASTLAALQMFNQLQWTDDD